ncbi:MAG: hypothetical protein LIO85_07815 [Rikenellaceae bacterium]|nr:hypothetical protein [Rikenellaceae bacterium]
MKKIDLRAIVFLFAALFLSGCKGKLEVHPELEKYVDFLEKQKTSAKEYIFSLFEDHDIVLLCERSHDERSQYDLVYDILGDRRFAANGGLLFTEVGSTGITEPVNAFLQGPDLSEQELRDTLLWFQRRLTWQPWARNGSSYDLMEAMYGINRSRTPDMMVTWYPTDVHLNWYDGIDREGYMKFAREKIADRDSLMAAHIIQVLDSVASARKGPAKALVIMNYRHAYGNDFVRDPGEKPDNTGRYLFDRYGDRIANVLINQLSFLEVKNGDEIYGPAQEGRWDAAFLVSGKTDIGFNFKGSPFGADEFDNWILNRGVHTYQDVFDGYIFYEPLERWVFSEGTDGLMDENYIARTTEYLEVIFDAESGGEYEVTEDFIRSMLMPWNQRIDKPYIEPSQLAVRDKWLVPAEVNE